MLSTFIDTSTIYSQIPWSEIIAGINTLVILGLGYVNKKLKGLIAETKNNGGSSLKDSLDRIEISVAALSMWIEAAQNLTTKAYYKTDASGNITWANNAFLKIVGASMDEVHNSKFKDFIVEEDYEKRTKAFEEALHERRKFQSKFKVKNLLNGEVREIESKAFPVVIKDELIGYLGSWTITDTITIVDTE